MKTIFKRLWLAVFIIAALFMFTSPALAGYDHYVINLYANKGFSTAAGGYSDITSGVRYIVFNGGGAKGIATIYSDAAGTAKSNPVEATTFEVLDRIDFYIADTVTTVDIAVMSLDGFATWLTGATTSTRTAIIDERPGILHASFADWQVTVCSQSALTGDATDYWTFPTDTLLLPWGGTEVITASSVSDVQLFGSLNGTAGALFNYHPTDGAKVFTFVSTLAGTSQSDTLGSVFLSAVACIADTGTYPALGSGYKVSLGTMGFTAASLPEEGDYTTVAEDLAWGWGFYHFWFINLQ